MSDELFPRAMSLAVHELWTPVTVAAGYLQMVLREQGGPLTPKQRKMLEGAERSCARISALVAEMSEMARLESRELAPTRQDIDLAALVTDVASDIREGADRGVQLDVRGTDRPVMVTGDRLRVAAAVRALVQATLRERGEPGVVIARLSVMTGAPTPWAVLTVGDESTVETLFAAAAGPTPPFDEWRGGLGMALPVARRVIEALGGSLWSAPGERTRTGSALRLPLR